jgi:LPS-assembly protein
VTRRLLAFLLLAAPAVAAVSPDATSVAAEHQETSLRTGETILTGHPHIDYGDLRLTADELRINPQTRTVVASGHAILTQGPRRLLADVITYHVADGTYEVGELRAGEYPVYLTGSSAHGDRQSLTVTNARVTVPEPGEFIPTLEAARLYFTADQKLRAEHAAFGLGSVHPIALPAFQHDAQHPLVSNVSVTAGYRKNLGAYAIAGMHMPVAPRFQLGGDVGFYSSRGVMAGPSGSYGGEAESASYMGGFRSGFINDYGQRGTDILDRPVPRNRGYVEWHHQQQIGDRFAITGELNYWKDSEVLRDFRPGEFFPVQQPDTFVEAAYTGQNYLVSLFSRFQPNSFQVVQQRLPELRFDLFPVAVGAGFYERFNASLAVLRQDALPASPRVPAPGEDLHSDRLDAYYSLVRPIHPTEWFTFTPVAGARFTHYSALSGPRDEYSRGLGELGFDTELHFSGTFDYKNPRWKIDGLRHLFTPRLSYRYIPEADKGRAYIPPIDAFAFSTFRSPASGGFSTYLAPLGLDDTRNLDRLHATNTLRLSFDNTLQTRDPVYGSRDLVRLNVANDFRFHREPGERDVSEIHTELALLPARWLELGVYQSFTPQDFTLREFNTGVTIRDGDEWAARFSSNFLRHELNDYFLQASRRLNEVFEAVVYLRYNERRRRFDEQSYGLRQNVKNTWSIEYTISLYEGRRRESRFGFNVRVDAVRF